MIRRNIENEIKAALADTPVVLLNGARQTGKTTLVKKLVSSRSARYVSLDDVTMQAAANSDPAGFVRGLGEKTTLLAIDEIQKAPGLFQALKVEVDNKRLAGRFLLTGSANVMLLPSVSESLAGRMEIVTLWPLSQGEISGRNESFIDAVFADSLSLPSYKKSETSELLKKMLIGGYPEVLSRPAEKRREAWFNSYITTILQRDIRDISNIEGLTDMPRLLRLLAARTGGLLNMSELSRSSAIPHTTLNRYLTLLKATFLLQPLQAWSANMSKRLLKSPKIYLIDSGIVSFLTGQTEKRLTEDPTFSGHLLENFVITELHKQTSWARTRVFPFHFRTTTGQEVDIVLEGADGQIAGIEIKASGSVGKKDFGGLEALAEIAGKKFLRGIILYNGDSAVSFGNKYHALPVSSLWLM